jgi:hypothetical protein
VQARRLSSSRLRSRSLAAATLRQQALLQGLVGNGVNADRTLLSCDQGLLASERQSQSHFGGEWPRGQLCQALQGGGGGRRQPLRRQAGCSRTAGQATRQGVQSRCLRTTAKPPQ